MAPNEFQSHLRLAMTAVADKARANKVRLPDKFYLGFDEFAAALPNEAAAPQLGQELAQIEWLLDTLFEARVDALTSFRRISLPDEHGTAAPASRQLKPGPAVAGSETTRAQGGGSDLCFHAGGRAKSPQSNRRDKPAILHHSPPARAKREGQRAAARTRRGCNWRCPRQRSIARWCAGSKTVPGCGAEFHRWQRTHRDIRQDRNREVHILSGDFSCSRAPVGRVRVFGKSRLAARLQAPAGASAGSHRPQAAATNP